MVKSYNEQLCEWVRRRPRPARHEKNRVAFLGVRDDVREALEQGWPAKTIWSHMVEQGRITFGYDTFLTYVKRHVPTAGAGHPHQSTGSRAPAKPLREAKGAEPAPPPRAQGPADDGLPGFTFHAAPNREELI